jgi:hypothetical protein
MIINYYCTVNKTSKLFIEEGRCCIWCQSYWVITQIDECSKPHLFLSIFQVKTLKILHILALILMILSLYALLMNINYTLRLENGF